MRVFLIVLSLLVCSDLFATEDFRELYSTPYERSDGNQTATYHQAIQYYSTLAAKNPRISLSEMGPTDSGRPLHLVLIADPVPSLDEVLTDSRSVLLVNNAIHPGEPDGVDASMAFARDLAFDDAHYGDTLKNVIVAVIPLYNIGGALNRNSGTRANQNGPEEYGFRGNARNYDLNRDFIKCDTNNARSFAEIFHQLDPDLFLDTHVSNGADYQHVMTTSHSQKDKLGLRLGRYLEDTFEPQLFSKLKGDGFPTIPYVNSGGQPPERGFSQFLETPRYSTGYTALFQTMGFMTETHMLKPYAQRVRATRAFLDRSTELLAEDGERIQEIRQEDRREYKRQQKVAIAWEVDRNTPSRLEFHGYEASYLPSEVTSGKRLFYDRSKPFVRDIPYYNNYVVSKEVTVPSAYVIPQGWHRVIELMKLNGVRMQRLQKAATVPAGVYHIEDVTTRSTPYEGHYFHDDVTAQKQIERVSLNVGDVIIPVTQDKARYIVETLEPEAMDSLFRWNYFDTILQRKEYFSPYIFEDSAKQMLSKDPDLAAEFEKRKREDRGFAANRRAQLTFLYERSNNAEHAYHRYPIIRLGGPSFISLFK